MIVFGQDELEKGQVKVKDMIAHTEIDVRNGEEYDEIVPALVAKGCTPVYACRQVLFLGA